jgi:hypothetical protein
VRIRPSHETDAIGSLKSARRALIFLGSYNGQGFVCRTILQHIVHYGIEAALLDPRAPIQNHRWENFSCRFRDQDWILKRFRSRREANVVGEARQGMFRTALGFRPWTPDASRFRGTLIIVAAPLNTFDQYPEVVRACAHRPVDRPLT